MVDDRPVNASSPLSEAAIVNSMYARRWGCYFSLAAPIVSGRKMRTQWCKVRGLQRALRARLHKANLQADHWVIYIDADAFISSPTQSPTDLVHMLTSGHATSPELIIGREDVVRSDYLRL